ncbi:MAG: N-acetyltransferase [Rhizobiaceae bacterium]|nr:N-acetyltransferase [Rhizobiaceae bacterium]MCV0406969.1 N-acetyltransferase [Rhizobiaceae bacterium]
MELVQDNLPPAAAFEITAEAPADIVAREALLDRAMGVNRKRKSSEKLRRGRLPAEGLVFVARDAVGRLVGTVRLWDVAVKLPISPSSGETGGGNAAALLLGPLAVDPCAKSAGIGSALMRHAIAEARRLGHGAIVLVGDEAYYGRFGFSSAATGRLAMPGPFEKHRLLALELEPGALAGAEGVIVATGRAAARLRRAAFDQSRYPRSSTAARTATSPPTCRRRPSACPA